MYINIHTLPGIIHTVLHSINPLNAKLNPVCHLLILLGAHPILQISRIKVNTKGSWWSKDNNSALMHTLLSSFPTHIYVCADSSDPDLPKINLCPTHNLESRLNCKLSLLTIIFVIILSLELTNSALWMHDVINEFYVLAEVDKGHKGQHKSHFNKTNKQQEQTH
jgi:hypothetical protein